MQILSTIHFCWICQKWFFSNIYLKKIVCNFFLCTAVIFKWGIILQWLATIFNRFSEIKPPLGFWWTLPFLMLTVSCILILIITLVVGKSYFFYVVFDVKKKNLEPLLQAIKDGLVEVAIGMSVFFIQQGEISHKVATIDVRSYLRWIWLFQSC